MIVAVSVLLAAAPTVAMAHSSAGDAMQLTDASWDWLRSETSVKLLPTPYDGWIQDSVVATADPEVRGWIASPTPCQRDPSAAGCGTSATAITP